MLSQVGGDGPRAVVSVLGRKEVACKFTQRESGAGAEIRDLVVWGFSIHWIRDDAKRVMASSFSAMISDWNWPKCYSGRIKLFSHTQGLKSLPFALKDFPTR